MDQLLPVYFERLLESSLDIVIAVDREGQVYFTQTNGKGIWKVSPKGELTLILV